MALPENAVRLEPEARMEPLDHAVDHVRDGSAGREIEHVERRLGGASASRSATSRAATLLEALAR